MKKSAVIVCALALAVMAALIIDPARYTQSITNGLLLYVASVLPSMLPFFFLSGLLTASGLASYLAGKGGKIVCKAYHAPPIGLYVMLVSILSGYPVGAKLTAELHSQGLLDDHGARKIVPFTSATGPMFLLGAVGANILQDYRAGLCILAAHYLATILNGFIFRGRRSQLRNTPLPCSAPQMDKLLWNTAYNTVISLLISAVFIVMFNLLADILSAVGVFGLLTRALHALSIPTDVANALVYGIAEMTRGCVLVSHTTAPIAMQASLCCLLVSFGGCCVALQSIAYLAQCHVNPLYFLLTKITQSALAFGLCYLFCLLL